MDNSEKKLSGEERRILRIAQMRAKLQKEEALLNQDRRKKRNGQLFAAGAMVEQVYKLEPAQRELLKKWATGYLDDRNRARMLEMFARLDADARAEVKAEPEQE